MDCQLDPRVAELEQLAREEGIKLPYGASYIAFLERHGRMVDLISGEVIYARIVAVPSANAKAICHLLAHVEGELIL